MYCDQKNGAITAFFFIGIPTPAGHYGSIRCV